MTSLELKVAESILHLLRDNPHLSNVVAASIRAGDKHSQLSSAMMQRFGSSPTFTGDGFATTHHVEFLADESFRECYLSSWEGVSSKLLWERDSFNLAWRAHICTWAAHKAISIPGDFVEFGVWYGILSQIICRWVKFEQHRDKVFFLFDTWGSLPGSHPSYQEDVYDIVVSRFKEYPNVRLVRGAVPNTLSAIDEVEKFAYVSIDMNSHLAERIALESVYHRVSPGGVIYFDDYGWNYPELRHTINEFLLDKPERLLHFPSGQSILIKS